jgi:hypothetical protein
MRTPKSVVEGPTSSHASFVRSSKGLLTFLVIGRPVVIYYGLLRIIQRICSVDCRISWNSFPPKVHH